ncbi:MAG TPA: amidohydrolase/deacetylase family metallohydrolase [Candidatus Latescibacteria bacterium]|nr:amidohydrolase/deacetylase family metallohydrolase [Gemmatimonadota bacterium]HCR19166.1 amidohydrolase/deacetylase family metallohydrolase [Candidatus Latescibacterota bacterium]|tara:strand:+ start:5005 stop:6165 length:1161 start_codon:yes stop_codon:yes gene_type:complete
MTTTYDLLIKGATVIDPGEGIHAHRDVAILGDRIAEVSEEIHTERAQNVIDATGKLVTPGLIDLHVHVWEGVSHFGVPPDPTCLARGVTTAFDAGSAGADTFQGFKKFIIDVSATRIRAFLHISAQGMLSADIGELTDIRYADVQKAIQTCEANKRDIVGIKIRMSRQLVGENGRESWNRAREVCEATGLPLMVHPNASPVSMVDMLDELRSGDIVTHCFHQSDTGILNKDGEVLPEVRRASEKGVRFDVGHGQGSFSFGVAEAALRQGVVPGTISSDLHVYNVNGPVYDQITTISKFLTLGFSLDEVIEKVTCAPAAAMGMATDIGSLRKGSCADISIIELEAGTFEYTDAHGETRIGEQKLIPVSTIRGGRLYAPSAFANRSPS